MPTLGEEGVLCPPSFPSQLRRSCSTSTSVVETAYTAVVAHSMVAVMVTAIFPTEAAAQEAVAAAVIFVLKMEVLMAVKIT